MTASGTTNDNEWQRMTTNDNEWQRMKTSGTTSGSTNESEWKRMRMIYVSGIDYIYKLGNWLVYYTFNHSHMSQYNILSFFYASISSCFSLSVLLKFIKVC